MSEFLSRDYLYFIRQGSDGPIKIGKSWNPGGRLRELQVGSPQELHLMLAVKVFDEREAHAEVEDDRIRGEWFYPTKRVFRLMRRLRGVAKTDPETYRPLAGVLR